MEWLKSGLSGEEIAGSDGLVIFYKKHSLQEDSSRGKPEKWKYRHTDRKLLK